MYTVTAPAGTVTAYTYNGAGQVLQEVQTFGTYSATTVHAYTTRGLEYCTITPIAYSKGHTTCPSAPTSPPTAGSDPWPGDSITIYDKDARPLYQVNPLGGVTQTSYNTAGSKYCTVTPNDYATGTTCHALPLTIPTQGHDTYLGETITTFNAQGQAIQRTDALGDITLTTYDGAGNVTKTVKESKTATVAPSVTTTTLYDTDNRPDEATTGTGSTAATTEQLYRSRRQRVLFGLGQPGGRRHLALPMPRLESRLGGHAAEPGRAVLEFAERHSGRRSESLLLQRHGYEPSPSMPTATLATAYDPDGRSYCAIDPGHPRRLPDCAFDTLCTPYSCPAYTATVPSAGSDPATH